MHRRLETLPGAKEEEQRKMEEKYRTGTVALASGRCCIGVIWASCRVEREKAEQKKEEEKSKLEKKLEKARDSPKALSRSACQGWIARVAEAPTRTDLSCGHDVTPVPGKNLAGNRAY